MEQTIQKFINDHQLIEPNDTVIVAVSGGPDSMALLHYLWTQRHQYAISVIACHLHHQLRGIEADEDANYIQEYCKQHHIDYVQKNVDVAQFANQQKLSIQLAARKIRYEWFSQLLSTYPKSKLATGHHGDDQVETIIMKMTRGSLPLQSFGIPVKRPLGNGAIIRPFLCMTKDDIEVYCHENSLHPRLDSSNLSDAYTRNRIRHHILPFLKKENEQVHTHLQRQSEWSSDDHHFLMELAKEILPKIIHSKNKNTIKVSRQALINQVVPLQRRLIHLLLSYLYGNQSTLITSIHIEQVLDLVTSNHSSGESHLMNPFYVRLEYDICVFSKRSTILKEINPVHLKIPGTVTFNQWKITASTLQENDYVEKKHQIVLDFDEIPEPLIVRVRQDGDEMTCRGMEGSKKIARLFIDRKIAKEKRDQWPIIVDDEGNILWVPLLHRTKKYRVLPSTQKRLLLSCELLN